MAWLGFVTLALGLAWVGVRLEKLEAALLDRLNGLETSLARHQYQQSQSDGEPGVSVLDESEMAKVEAGLRRMSRVRAAGYSTFGP